MACGKKKYQKGLNNDMEESMKKQPMKSMQKSKSKPPVKKK